MPSSFIGSKDYIEENDYVEYDSRENVESVKTGNEEKEISKNRISVFVDL